MANKSLSASSYQKVFDNLRPIITQAQIMPSPLPRVARHFCRIFTNNEGQCDSVNHACLNMLLNRHYIEKWATGNSSAMSWGDNRIQSPRKTPLIKFHESFSSRFNTLINSNKNIQSSVQCTSVLAQKDEDSLREHHLFDQDNFVSGHQIVLKDFLIPFPLVVVAFFDKSTILKSNHNKFFIPKTHNYFVPLEQALLMTKRKQILERLALLEGNKNMLGGWGVSYTGTAIGLISPNTRITGSIGIVASQTYAPIQKDDLRKRCGGATQLYIAKTDSDITFIDINAIREINQGTSNYSIDDKLYLVDEFSKIGLLSPTEATVFLDITKALDLYP